MVATRPGSRRPGRWLGGPARAFDAVHVRQGLGETPGVGVVVGQAIDHAGRTVGQGDEAGRGQDADLAHPATDELARAARARDDVVRADQDRPDRAAEALGQAERHGVRRIGQVPGRHAGRPLGDHGVPEASAIDVERDAVAARDGGDLAGVRGRQRLAHRVGMGVLERDEARQRLVGIGRVAERGVDGGRVQGAVRPVFQAARARADDDRVPGRLVDDEVMLRAGDDLLATAEMGHHRREIAHRPARDEEAGLLAEELRGAFLEGDDGRVVAEDVVAEFGLGHRPAHGVGGPRNGVAAEVDRSVRHRRRV